MSTILGFLAVIFLFAIKVAIFLIGIYFLMMFLNQQKEGAFELIMTSFHERYGSAQLKLLQKISPKDKTRTITKDIKNKNKIKQDHNLFVIEFNGDLKASQTDTFKEIITILCSTVKSTDEVLIILESPGGQVHQYGYAASQLVRLRERCLLTVAIDKVGASGGYLMAVVAHHIIAAPFAIVGSIGVIGQVPNINKLLKKNFIDIEEHTAGAYKRSLSIFGENSDQNIERFKQELQDTHILFQNFVKEYRPQVADSLLTTGEHCYASFNLQEYGLVDTLITSDAYILESSKLKNVVFLKTEPKKSFMSWCLNMAHVSVDYVTQVFYYAKNIWIQ
jgi:serine protease SohB